MGRMSDYVNNKQLEVKTSNGLIVNYRKLWEIREGLTNEIEAMSDVLKSLNMELVNVDDMIFEIQEKLESRGIKVE
jgi:hypothetical protein